MRKSQGFIIKALGYLFLLDYLNKNQWDLLTDAEPAIS